MVYRTERTGTRTLASPTDTYTTPIIEGKLLAIKFINTSGDKVSIVTAGDLASEDVFGTSAAPITLLGTSNVYYPRVVGNLASTGAALGAANQTNVFVEMMLNSPLTFSISNGTTGNSWAAELIYEV